MKYKIQHVMIIGLAINALLFISKIWIAYVSGSQSMRADAFNNFSDILATVIMFVGVRLAMKPADKHHPYGHERYELIGGFLVSILMLYLGIDLIRFNSSSSNALVSNKYVLVIALLSVVLKGFLYLMYRQAYQSSKAPILIAGMSDSRNDVFLSSAIVGGVLLQNTLNFDWIIGLGIALVIVVDALRMIKDYMSQLVGERPSSETIDAIERILKAQTNILGYHDLVIHKYGTRHGFASVHVTVDDRMSLNDTHQITVLIEKAIRHDTKLQCLVHIDPVDVSDERLIKVQNILDRMLGEEVSLESYHDLRFIEGILHIEFVVAGSGLSDRDLRDKVERYLKVTGYPLDLKFDRNYLLS